MSEFAVCVKMVCAEVMPIFTVLVVVTLEHLLSALILDQKSQEELVLQCSMALN